MSFILSKILLFILKPIIWVFAVFLFALFSKNKKLSHKLFILGLCLLFLFSNAFLSGKVYNLYEASYPAKKQYDIGILLGGYSKSGNKDELVLSDRGDRLMQAIYLLKKGTISKILISGGSGRIVGTESNEGDLTLKYLKAIGIPDSAILLDNQSRNTIENAKFSLNLIHKSKPNTSILVITSAWHVPRSKMIFEKVFKHNLDFYPTDFIGKENYDISDYYLPDASALNNWEFIIKEWVGLFIDRYRI